MLVAVAWGVVLIVSTMIVAGAWQTGVAWDETYHVERMQNRIDHGWYLLDRDLTDGYPKNGVHDRFVYGPATMSLLEIQTPKSGLGHPDVVSAGAGDFGRRHIGIAGMGLATAILVGFLTALALGRWRWGVIGSATLLAIPLWSGHSMFNIKDVPVGLGFTMLTTGLVLAAHGGRRRTRTVTVIAFMMVAGGVALAAGTRPGIWPGLLASAGAFALISLSRWLRGTNRPLVALRAGTVALATVTGGLLVLALYPSPFRYPILFAVESVASSSGYRDSETSPLYVPVMVVLQTPSGLLGFLLAGAAIGVVSIWRWRVPTVSHGGVPFQVRGDVVAIIATQALVLPLLAIVASSSLYNGLRQLLFAVPAAAALVVIGMAVVLHGRRSRILPLVAVAALIAPVLDQATLFPYNYTYYSEIADLGEHDLETDYWRTSVRELAPSLHRGDRTVCSPYVIEGKAQRFGFDGMRDCLSDPIGPLVPFRTEMQPIRTEPLEPEEFVAVIERTARVPINCRAETEVTRIRHFRRQVMSFSATCRTPLPTVAVGGLHYTGADQLGNSPAGESLTLGWDVMSADTLGVPTDGRVAELAFEAPDGMGRSSLRVTLEGTVGGRDPEFLVNGRPVPVEKLDDGFVLVVPRQVSRSEQGMVVSLSAGQDSDVQFRLRRLEVGAEGQS